MNIRNLSDKELLNKTKTLVNKERECTYQIIKNFEEIYRRRLFSDLGYPSLFVYATDHLGYSPSQAQRRINAAKLICDLPEVEFLVKKGSMSLSSASSLQSFIKLENKNRVRAMDKEEKLDLALKIEGKSARETERILKEQSSDTFNVPRETKRAIKGTRIQIKFSMEEKEYDELIELMERFNIDNIEEMIIKLKNLAKVNDEKDKKTPPKPKRVTKPTKIQNSRYIPKAVKRQVEKRANQKCEICGSKHNLQFDHHMPFAKGGTNDIENIRLLCRSCNQRWAIKEFGLKKMKRFINPL